MGIMPQFPQCKGCIYPGLRAGVNGCFTRALLGGLASAFARPPSYSFPGWSRGNGVTIFIRARHQKAGSGAGFRTEREGFEPSIELPLYSISSAAPSTTRPPLQGQNGATDWQCSSSPPPPWLPESLLPMPRRPTARRQTANGRTSKR